MTLPNVDSAPVPAAGAAPASPASGELFQVEAHGDADRTPNGGGAKDLFWLSVRLQPDLHLRHQRRPRRCALRQAVLLGRHRRGRPRRPCAFFVVSALGLAGIRTAHRDARHLPRGLRHRRRLPGRTPQLDRRHRLHDPSTPSSAPWRSTHCSRNSAGTAEATPGPWRSPGHSR
ncbi:hypothetical protein ACU686_00170 [Yinghuangia aomiensis]